MGIDLLRALLQAVFTSVVIGLVVAYYVNVRTYWHIRRITGEWRFFQLNDEQARNSARELTIKHAGWRTVEISTGKDDPEQWIAQLEFRVGDPLQGKGPYRYRTQQRWGTLELMTWEIQPKQLYVSGIGYNKEGHVVPFAYELVRP